MGFTGYISAFVLTEDQFNVFLANYSSLSQRETTFPHYFPNEASKTQNRNGALYYNVTESRDYIALIRTQADGANVSPLEESTLTYTYQTKYTIEMQMVPQNDDLYLYVGFVFLVTAVLTLIVLGTRRERK